MSNADKVKYRKLKTTNAEAVLKRKYEETVNLGKQMNKNKESEEEIDKRLAEQRRQARLKAKQEEQNALREQQENATEQASSINGAQSANIHNNINVNINYTVNQTTADSSTIGVSRRRNTSKKGKKGPSAKQREQEIMNSSLSKMLDQHLLASNSKDIAADGMKNVSSNVADSLTQKIFHGENIYLQHGAMAFKPLGMETVLESIDEQHASLDPQAWKKGVKTKATRYHSNKLAPQTTEQNIALQQKLDFASAEEFLTFGRFSQLGLHVKEDPGARKMAGENAYSSSIAAPGGLRSMPMQQQQVPIPVARSVSKKELPSTKKQSPQVLQKEVRSKSSLKNSGAMTPLKREIPEESRQVHSGLQQMEARLQAKTLGLVTPAQGPLSALHDDRSNFSSALLHQLDSDQFNTPGQTPMYIRYNDSSINQIIAQQQQQQLLLNSDRKEVTGASTFDGKNNAKPIKPEPRQHPGIGLHRQNTKNTKEWSRKLRADKVPHGADLSDEVEPIEADTVLAEQEQPLAMPHRMRSNATFQPKSNKIEPTITLEKPDGSVHEDNISQLAIDYGMHQQNKKRIQNLMALLGAKGGPKSIQSIEDLDIHIGDSMSNIDATSQQTKSKQSKMAGVSQRIQEIISNEHGSTQVGTTVKPSSKNLASYARGNRSIESKASNQQNEKNRQRQAAFESSAGAYSNIKDLDVETNSILNQSIDGTELNEQNAQRMKTNKSHLNNVKLKNEHHIDQITNVQYLMRGGDLRKQSEQSPINYFTRNADQYDDRDNQGKKSMRTTNHSGLNQLRKNPKYALVRSSMFNKNPIFDKMDVQMLSINDNDSDRISIGMQSQQARNQMPQRGVGRDYFSVIGGQKKSVNENQDAQSSKTLKVRSMSSKKLRPVNYLKPSWKMDKNTLHAQSLQFNQGLSYVMVKGQVQPSEKYIYKSMMPYTNAQQFQSVQIKSSKDRHSLLLQQVETQQPQHSQQNTGKNTKKKKLKGAKMTRAENLKLLKKAAAGGVSGSQTTRRKTVIVEQDDEYSGSEGEPNIASPNKNNETWQELQLENNQMKEQILNQIAIFEQYLKVAILQHKAREREDKEQAKRLGVRHNSVDNEVFKRKDFEFDNKKIKQQYLQQSGTKNQSPSKKLTKNLNTASAKKITTYKQKGPKIHSSEVKIISSAHHSSQPSIGVSQRDQSPVRAHITMHDKQRRSKRSASKHSRNGSVEDADSEVDQRSKSPDKIKFIMNKNVTNANKIRALQHLLPISGNKSINTNNTAHITHQVWIQKIQALWRRLNRRRNEEIVRIQNEIKRNKRHITELTRDNMFELDVNFNDQKIFMQARSKHSSLNKRLKYGNEQKQLRELQTRIRDEIAKKADFDTWGFHNHIIEYRLKVRMTEDVIDCAQRLQVKPDTKTQRELDLLKMLRDRTYDDLKYFIEEREKRPWRVWDKFGYYFKPPVENLTLNYRQLQERIEIHMQMIAYIEPRYATLIYDIPPYNAINSEMIQFCTEMFGNEGWLQMFQIRQLRKQQDDEQNDKQYMPPVDHIKKLEVDPYTLQIAPEAQEEPIIDSQEEKKPYVSWWARKPDKLGQGNLKTGYEPIIEERKKARLQQKEIQKNYSGRDDSIDDNDNGSLGRDDESFDGIEQSRSFKNLTKRSSLPITIAKHRSNMILHEHYELEMQSNAPISEAVGDRISSHGGNNRFEGDVVQHLKDQVVEQEGKEKVQKQVEAIKKSSWLQVLEKERAAKAEREAAERKQRAARLAILFEEEDVESQDDEDILDAGAAKQDVADYIEKIDTHLQVEKRLLEAWQENDDLEGGPK